MTASKMQIVQLAEYTSEKVRCPGVDSAMLLASTARPRASACILAPYLQSTHNACSHRALLSHAQVSIAQYTRGSICLL